MERPRNKEHGDYATNVALQLAKKAGMPPRELAQSLADALGATDGIAKVDIAGPGFLNITVSAGAQGKVAADVVAAGASYGRSETLAGHEDQRGVHLRQPDRPAAPRSHPLGGRRRRHRAGPRRCRRRGRPGVLHQRPGQPDGEARPSRWRRPPRVSRCRTTATTVTTSAISPRQVVAEQPGILDLPEGERLVAFREAAYAHPAGRAAASSWTGSGPTSTSGSPSARCTTGQRSPRTSRSSGVRGTSSTMTAPCGCVRRTRVTTRTGC